MKQDETRKRLQRYVETKRKEIENVQTEATAELPPLLTKEQVDNYRDLLLRTEEERELYSSFLCLPSLSGTHRQRPWAQGIRDDFVLTALKAGIKPAALKGLLDGLTSCRWWIDHRFVIGLIPVMHFLNNYEEKEGK